MPKKKRLPRQTKYRLMSIVHHNKAGETLQNAYNDILTLECELSRYFGKTTAPTVMAGQIVKKLQEFRSLMDDLVCRDYPEYDFTHRLYYRNNLTEEENAMIKNLCGDPSPRPNDEEAAHEVADME